MRIPLKFSKVKRKIRLTMLRIDRIVCVAMLNTKADRKSAQIGIRLDPETRAQLEALASAEHRSVSSYVRLLILRALDPDTDES